jgi:hypothetical protein
MFNQISAFFGGSSPNMSSTQHQYSHGYSETNQTRSILTPPGVLQNEVQSAQHGDQFYGTQHMDRTKHMDRDETSDRDDLLDQHVAYYLKHHPDVQRKNSIVKVRPGVYNVNGRDIAVEWQYADNADQPGYLLAVDGPLRQPFSDYMQNNEYGIQYDEKKLGRSALYDVPKGNRLSFGDDKKMYSRLEAMKVAKEQAIVREKAAAYLQNGMAVPQEELMQKYNKTISQRLGERRQRQPEAEVQPEMPQLQAEPPVAPPLPPTAQSPAQGGKNKQTHGAPKYCANHDRTEKRKKCKPQNLPCSRCQAVIQTNYVEYSLCPSCSEKEHRCMCCGAPAVGSPSIPAPSTPMNAQASPNHANSKSTPQPSPMSPTNLFGMPDLFNGSPAHRPGTQPIAPTAFPSYTPQPAVASPAQFGSPNAFASYNPMASQNIYVGRR